MAPHSSALAWKIPWREEPGGLQSMGSLRVGHDWVTSLSLFTFMHWRRKWQPTPVFLSRESQGRGSLVGCCLWGRRVGHNWSDLAAAAATVSRQLPWSQLWVLLTFINILCISPFTYLYHESCVFIGRTDAEAETPILWPPHAKNWLIGKDSDAQRDWGQEEKGKTDDEMAGWHHQLDGHEFE